MSGHPPFTWCTQPNCSIQLVNQNYDKNRRTSRRLQASSCNSNKTYIFLKKGTTTLWQKLGQRLGMGSGADRPCLYSGLNVPLGVPRKHVTPPTYGFACLKERKDFPNIYHTDCTPMVTQSVCHMVHGADESSGLWRKSRGSTVRGCP